MRIAVGQLWQETNTFNENVTRWSDFDATGIARGDEVLTRYGRTGELSGFLTEFSRLQPTARMEGLARFACWPSGAIEAATWQRIRQVFQEELQRVGPVDGVYLTLHGALCSEDDPDVTGSILQLVREAVGPGIPVTGSLDLHANITPRMLNQASVLAGYHTSPHVDGVETGARAARALSYCLGATSAPVTYSLKLPMITAAESHNTFTGPPTAIYERLKDLERQPGVLSAGLYMAMPWFDCPGLGWTITLTVREPDRRWLDTVHDLANQAWELRTVMEDVDRLSPRDVVDRALSVDGIPVVIGDGADATNSGATGDSTVLLREFLSRPQIPDGALTFLVDPAAVKVARQAGVGSVFDAEIGGRLSSFSKPVRFQGRVEQLLDVKWVLSGHISKNMPIDMGAGAVVRSGDVTVLLCERSGPGSSPDLYRCAGLDPRLFRIVVAKSPAGFRADYSAFAAAMLLADCPGSADPHWDRMPFKNVTRPLWPLDAIDVPEQAGWIREYSLSESSGSRG